jgi:hypothetical protein
MDLGRTGGARVFFAVAFGAIVVRLLSFRGSGTARSWPWSPGRRSQVLAALVALLLGVAYGMTHAFVADGSGGNYGSPTMDVRVGHVETVDIGLSPIWSGSRFSLRG